MGLGGLGGKTLARSRLDTLKFGDTSPVSARLCLLCFPSVSTGRPSIIQQIIRAIELRHHGRYLPSHHHTSWLCYASRQKHFKPNALGFCLFRMFIPLLRHRCMFDKPFPRAVLHRGKPQMVRACCASMRSLLGKRQCKKVETAVRVTAMQSARLDF
jgi:hypothetical protein